ncbi:hypothetical protein [Caulobacter sp. 17J65-9]|uniref:hypothetical protein n=1 Tax=Caulobacter sp. 17J65-9 TaxID=2709382 RepID=UPI0013CAFAA0|nr:hypothetical protein [Caulobacter sp. 17J65-9]NEX94894.1 hypothetical protein [Caulobacter sp. 17J65-9]
MTLRNRLLSAAVTLAAALTAAQAAACEWANDYAHDAATRRSPASAYADAATVDWIRIEPPGPPACPRPPKWQDDEAAMDRAWEAYPAECQGLEPANVRFTASVVERLKGASPDRFDLFDRGRGGDHVRPLTDLRSGSAVNQVYVGLHEKATADRRHRTDAFWLDGDLGPSRDGRDSCGGLGALDPRMSYVVFRDAGGAVTALEPVLYGDDELLARLRRAASEPAALARPVSTPDFFRGASRLILVQVDRCRSGERDVQARLLRGDADAFPREDYREVRPNESELVRVDGIDVDFLHDWFVWTHGRCGGQTLLVVDRGYETVPAAELDWDYALAEASEARDDRAMPDRATYVASLSGRYSPRVVEVRDGRLRPAELSPEAALLGPAEITVDEAFAWFDEGRAARVRR